MAFVVHVPQQMLKQGCPLGVPISTEFDRKTVCPLPGMASFLHRLTCIFGPVVGILRL